VPGNTSLVLRWGTSTVMGKWTSPFFSLNSKVETAHRVQIGSLHSRSRWRPGAGRADGRRGP
jgi:hypothetical protein